MQWVQAAVYQHAGRQATMRQDARREIRGGLKKRKGLYCNNCFDVSIKYPITYPSIISLALLSTPMDCAGWQSCETGLPRALRLLLQPCGSFLPRLPRLFSSTSSLLLHFIFSRSFLFLLFFFLALFLSFFTIFSIAVPSFHRHPDSCSRNRTYPSGHSTAL